MIAPTAEEIRTKLPQIDWETLGVADDAALDELIADAVDQIGIVTGWVLPNVPTMYERTMVRAIALMAAWLQARQSEDVLETAADWDLVASLTAGSFSETRRAGKDALVALQLINPWPPLAGLLWNLLLPLPGTDGNPNVNARYDYWISLMGQPAPAFDVIEVDWGGEGMLHTDPRWQGWGH